MPFDKYRVNPFSNLIRSYMNNEKYTAEERWDTIMEKPKKLEPEDYESWVNRLDFLIGDKVMLINKTSNLHELYFYQEWKNELNVGTTLDSEEKVIVNAWYDSKMEEASNIISNMMTKQPMSILRDSPNISVAPYVSDHPIMESGHIDKDMFPYDNQLEKQVDEGYGKIYFPPRPGYTITFVAGLAFQIPEFYILDKATTYEIWKRHPKLEGKVVYIYPNVDRVPAILDWADFEGTMARWNRGVLWQMWDNVAFENDTISQFISNFTMKKYTVKLSYFQRRHSTSYHPVDVCYKLDDLDDDMHPQKNPRGFNKISLPYVLNFLISLGFSYALHSYMRKPKHVGKNVIFNVQGDFINKEPLRLKHFF